MDKRRFDVITKALVEPSSRRRALHLLAGSGLGITVFRHELSDAGASHFGCVHVGKGCKRGTQCCSGVCRGKKGKKTCRTRRPGTCTRTQEDICKEADYVAANCNADPGCSCYTTTGGARFCGSDPFWFCPPSGECKRDSHCGGGAACVVDLDECGDCGPLGTFCVPPCGG